MNKNYINPILAIFLSVLLIGGSIGSYLYASKKESEYKTQYEKEYNKIKKIKKEEVDSPIRTIFNQISSISDLVYNMSQFHTPPTKIIEEIEKAIYIGRDKRNNYKIITNENFSFSNYNTVSFGLISTKLEYYPELIKKLKKIYKNTFEIEGLKNFGIQRERDGNGKLTGKVFFNTSITLKYLKDQNNTNINEGEIGIDGQEKIFKTVVGNKERLVLLNQFIQELASKRKEEGKTELYFNSETKDNSLYLNTDIDYSGKKDIFYINNKNNLIDILSLNGVGTKSDYELFKEPNFSALLIVDKDGKGYGLCGKIEKENLTKEEERQKELTGKEFTEIYEAGTFKLDKTLKTFCELL